MGRDARRVRPILVCNNMLDAGYVRVMGRTHAPCVPTSQSKARDDAKRGGNGGEHGDEELNDFSPDF